MLLAQLFAEDRAPPVAFWAQPFVSSRLLEYEVFSRMQARGAALSHGDDARQLLERVNLIEMYAETLGRALLPFAPPVRTLEALHLATLVFLRSRGFTLTLATHDQRFAASALTEGFALANC